VRWLPLICSLLAAAALAPVAVRILARSALARENHRGRLIAAPLGLLIAGPALLTLSLLALTRHGLVRGTLPAAAFVLGVALLGLVDDALRGPARGVRGHLRALRCGHADTGALKALGTLALALAAASWSGLHGTRLALAVAVLVLTPHALNLLDLRPGRAIKVFALVVGVLLAATRALRPLWLLGPFIGPVAVVALYDLRERGMLGDSGASLLGALAGIWLVVTLPTAGLAVACAALVVTAVYGELRSISALVARAPLLRRLDSIGRPA